MDKKIIQEIDKLQTVLGKWFYHAYHSRASMALVYEKGTDVEEQIFDVWPEYRDMDGIDDLLEALDFIHLLHDSDTRIYHAEHKEEVYYHMRRLG